MKRVLCLILILVLCFSMACPAFAANRHSFVKSPSHVPGFGPGHGHGHGHGNGNAGSGSGGSWIPKTGDVIMMWVIIMVISLIALAAVAVVFRKKFSL